MVFNQHNTLQIFLLELLSFSPLIIILGNVVPPFPLKIQFIGFGLAFVVSLLILTSNATKKWLLYFFAFYIIIQLILDSWHPKYLIDFFFGPFILVITLDIIANNKLPIALLEKCQKRFYSILWVPLVIASFQYFELIPLTFWNATYVNAALIDGNYIPRPNGFLYHGSELSVLILFTCLFQYFKKESIAFWVLLLLIIIASFTLYKTILATSIILFLYFLLFINTGGLSKFQLIPKKKIYWYGGLTVVVITIIVIKFFLVVHSYTGYYFLPQMLTGRGSIWNIYIDAVKDYSFWNWLFGSGMGSAFDLFETYASPDNFFPLTISKKLYVHYDPHNAIFNVFISAGIVGLSFLFFIFKMIYSQIVQWFPSASWNKRMFIAIFIIPLLTAGVTINFYDMAIFWVCLSFLLIRWNAYHHQESYGR